MAHATSVAPRNAVETSVSCEIEPTLQHTVKLRADTDVLHGCTSDQCIGGLRHTARTLAKMTVMRESGALLRGFLLDVLRDRPELVKSCLDCVGTDAELPFDYPFLVSVRAKLVQFYAQHGIEVHPDADSLADPAVCLRWNLLDAWCRFAGDPDDQVPSWIRNGAPAGILLDPLYRNVFPYDGMDAVDSPDSLHTELNTFANY
eukprot:1810197-Amphidinium_carterae.1